jgi:membrane protease YdiL (CAAX protease family)
MDINLYHQNLKVVIPVVFGLIGFIIFWFTQKSEKLKQSYLNKYGADQGSAKFIMFTKYLGGFSMGVIPLVVYLIVFPKTRLSELGFGLNIETLLASILWTVGLCIIIIPLAGFSAKKPENLVNYPQIRAKEWDAKMISGNLFAWAVYLLGYELLFRGVLLFPLIDQIGLWPAIAINIGLYSATHIPKGLSETIGAIPLSIVLCLLTVSTGTIWIAFFVHVAMAWTNSLTALKHHPDMKIIRKKRG